MIIDVSLSLPCLHSVTITSIVTTIHPPVICFHIHLDPSNTTITTTLFFKTSSILSHPFLAAYPSSILCLLIHYFVFCVVSLYFSLLFPSLTYPSIIQPPPFCFFLFYFVCFVIFGCSKSHSFCPCSIRASTSPDPVSVATNTPAATGNLPQPLSQPPTPTSSFPTSP